MRTERYFPFAFLNSCSNTFTPSTLPSVPNRNCTSNVERSNDDDLIGRFERDRGEGIEVIVVEPEGELTPLPTQLLALQGHLQHCRRRGHRRCRHSS